jgi:hypothetical protein
MNGMSDEPKKHTRAWFLWALIASLPLAYLLALGPVASRALLPGDPKAALNGIYAPVGWLCEHSYFARQMVSWYIAWWL